MNLSLFFKIFLISLFSISKSSPNDDKLIFVMTHFRHGARAPLKIDNKNQDLLGEYWTNQGELTGIGQRMHYLLGLRNRIRYIDELKFLSDKFDPHEILIYSTSVNRTLVSVSAQLQGLYPQSAEKGETLTKEQEKVSYPQVNVNNSKIHEEIKNLNLCALPYSMTLAPIRMINMNERKIRLFDLQGCTEKVEEIKKKNRETIPILIELVDDFNNRYGAKVNQFFNTTSEKYDLLYMNTFCDSFIMSYSDTRNLTEFKKLGIDFEELLDYCMNYTKLNFMEHYSGDEEHILPHLEASTIMAEFIYYMKKRIDADINQENIEEQYKDYSRPKMLILSGHETTISLHEVFLMDALGFDKDFFIFPKFASQVTFEVTTKNNGIKKQNYSDYYVNYYFDDDLLFNMTVPEFIEKIEAHIWDTEKINDYCGLNEEIIVINGNKTNTGDDNAKKAYKILMIIFIILSVILLALSIFLLIKLNKKNTELLSKSYILQK